MTRAVHMIVKGRVQGVGFRYFVKKRAAALGITGYVKNRPDGSVEIEADADSENINEFVSDVRTGPAFSNVTEVDLTDRMVSVKRDQFLIEF